MSVIEADCAEDKGSRHTMEDAWVVLPDASLDYEGPLRLLSFYFYVSLLLNIFNSLCLSEDRNVHYEICICPNALTEC